MHTLHETFWGRTNRVAGEEEGHRAAKSNGVVEGDGQRPLHTAMGAGDDCRRTGKPDGDCLGRRGPGVLAARSSSRFIFRKEFIDSKRIIIIGISFGGWRGRYLRLRRIRSS